MGILPSVCHTNLNYHNYFCTDLTTFILPSFLPSNMFLDSKYVQGSELVNGVLAGEADTVPAVCNYTLAQGTSMKQVITT